MATNTDIIDSPALNQLIAQYLNSSAELRGLSIDEKRRAVENFKASLLSSMGRDPEAELSPANAIASAEHVFATFGQPELAQGTGKDALDSMFFSGVAEREQQAQQLERNRIDAANAALRAQQRMDADRVGVDPFRELRDGRDYLAGLGSRDAIAPTQQEVRNQLDRANAALRTQQRQDADRVGIDPFRELRELWGSATGSEPREIMDATTAPAPLAGPPGPLTAPPVTAESGPEGFERLVMGPPRPRPDEVLAQRYQDLADSQYAQRQRLSNRPPTRTRTLQQNVGSGAVGPPRPRPDEVLAQRYQDLADSQYAQRQRLGRPPPFTKRQPQPSPVRREEPSPVRREEATHAPIDQASRDALVEILRGDEGMAMATTPRQRAGETLDVRPPNPFDRGRGSNADIRAANYARMAMDAENEDALRRLYDSRRMATSFARGGLVIDPRGIGSLREDRG